MSIRCLFGKHARRDQEPVGYCPRCGNFRGSAIISGRLCVLYVSPVPESIRAVMGGMPVPPRPANLGHPEIQPHGIIERILAS